jgi:hypothetical protein
MMARIKSLRSRAISTRGTHEKGEPNFRCLSSQFHQGTVSSTGALGRGSADHALCSLQWQWRDEVRVVGTNKRFTGSASRIKCCLKSGTYVSRWSSFISIRCGDKWDLRISLWRRLSMALHGSQRLCAMRASSPSWIFPRVSSFYLSVCASVG